MCSASICHHVELAFASVEIDHQWIHEKSFLRDFVWEFACARHSKQLAAPWSRHLDHGGPVLFLHQRLDLLRQKC